MPTCQHANMHVLAYHGARACECVVTAICTIDAHGGIATHTLPRAHISVEGAIKLCNLDVPAVVFHALGKLFPHWRKALAVTAPRCCSQQGTNAEQINESGHASKHRKHRKHWKHRKRNKVWRGQHKHTKIFHHPVVSISKSGGHFFVCKSLIRPSTRQNESPKRKKEEKKKHRKGVRKKTQLTHHHHYPQPPPSPSTRNRTLTKPAADPSWAWSSVSAARATTTTTTAWSDRILFCIKTRNAALHSSQEHTQWKMANSVACRGKTCV